VSVGEEDLLATDAGSVATLDAPTVLRGIGALTAGQIVDHYEIGECIGSGGMGEVYRAIDRTLQRTVAIKIMRPSAEQDRLLAEAQALAKLSHPNVVVVHEAGLVDNRVFIAMEYVEGATLRTWLTPERTWRDIVAMYLAAGRGLVALHRANLVHRDIKPENVLVGADGRPRVADLGLAARVAEDPHVHGGTPRYMAPEQRAGIVDARSDQFAFAVALWEALAGAPPFDASTSEELRLQIERAIPTPPPEGRTFPARIRTALERALRVSPDERWPSLADLLVELERDPSARRRRIAATAGGVLVVGLAVVGGLELRGDSAADACDSVAQRIAWTPFDAMAVRARFVETQRAHAPATADLVRVELDRYANGWRDQRREVCLAAARHEQTDKTAELRVRCLDRLADQLRALTTVFEHDADAALVDRAVGAVDQLTPTDTCASTIALADIPPPSPTQAARVDGLRKVHDATVAAFRAGRFTQDITNAREQVAQARTLGYAPTLAEALVELAGYEAALHDDAASERDYTDAITAAGEAHDDGVANTAWRGLVDLAVAHQKFDTAAERLVFARAASARSGSAPAIDTGLDLAEANLLYARGDYPAALVRTDQAIGRIAHASLAADDRAAALTLRARILGKLHRDPEGLAAMREAEQIWERELGSEHPNIASALVTIATAENSLLQFDAAKRDLDRALALAESIYGADSLNVALALDNRCVTRIGLHQVVVAKTDCERALAIKTAHDGPDGMTLAGTLTNLAKIAEQQDDLEHSQRLRERILAIHVKALGENHPEVAHDLFNLGSNAQSLHDNATARTSFERGQRIATAINDPTLIADGAISLASLYSSLGLHAEARAQMRIALAGHEALDKAHHTPFSAMNIAVDHKIVGGVELAAGNFPAAEAEVRKAIELMEVAGADQSDLVNCLGILGAILIEEHKHHDLVVVARHGIAICEATNDQGVFRGGLYFELAQGLWEDGDHAGALAAAQTARGIYAKLPQVGDVKSNTDELEEWLKARH